jgi:hypothetical protein
MFLQASAGIRPHPPAKWPISAKDGAVKSDHTLPLRRGAGIFPSPCKRSAAGRGQGEGREYVNLPGPVQEHRRSIPARQWINRLAPALPFILTCSPAAKGAAKAQESVHG